MTAISFHCFLIVAIFFPFALAESNQLCGNKSKIRTWELCCDGHVYRIAGPVRAWESCNVEPKNATLTFADSAWLVYDCNVRQRLNSTNPKLESYFNLLFLAQNKSQNLLWETLTFSEVIYKRIEGEDEHDKIKRIKLYHRECAQAVKQACTFGGGRSTFKRYNRVNILVLVILNLSMLIIQIRSSFLENCKECL